MTTQEHLPNNRHRAELHEVPKPELSPIEYFLKTPAAEREMQELYKVLDQSGAIVKTIRGAIQKTLDEQEPNIYSLFLHPDSSEGLTDEELVKLYDTNPLVRSCMRLASLKHNSGDDQAARVYRDTLRISMNVIRYEWINGSYDPLDPVWQDRASRLGDYSGSEKLLHLQPGFKRSSRVPQPRRSTPSDELPPHPSTP